jgi:V/A-type H+-transporting ATPase subunit I
MSLFYFVIFGLMFADVGYGLLLIACCFGGIKLLNPRTGMKRMLSMFGYCGISCVIMGVIFGGWFGDLPVAIMTNLLHLPVDTGVGHFFSSGLWFNPLDDPMTFLIFSLVIGAIHMITGMAINFYVLCKHGRLAEALCTILPYWVLFGGLALLLVDFTIGGIVAALGAVLILALNGYGQKGFFPRVVKGLGGLYGLISYASDLLSYSRILALGLVAGVIAKVINLITMMGDGNPIGFVIMIIVLLIGHLLNIAINLLGTFIHASRLQYLEFFGKFFEDGGVPFDPALPAEEYSEEISD